jgi:type IV pilus assembly protein PilC
MNMMPTYRYKAISKNYTPVEDTISGPGAWYVRKMLEKRGLLVVRLERDIANNSGRGSVFTRYARLSSYSQILFFRNFAMMLDSGIVISRTLETLSRQMRGIAVRSAIMAVRDEVVGGKRLSQAMERYPRLFPYHIVRTVAVGERSGMLAVTMDKISIDVEKNYELRRKVIGAMLYPVIIIAFMILTAFLMVIFVLPQLTNMFTQLGAPVPTMTRVLQTVGEFIVAHPIQLSTIFILILSTYLALLRIRAFRLLVHKAILHMPIFGPLVLEYNLVRMSRTLTTLISSGLTFADAVETAKTVFKNEAYREALDRIYPIILHGGSFSDALRTSPFLFPDQLLQLVIVGEESGKVGYALEKASTHYERSVQFQTQMLTTVIEPILMLVAGVLVGSLAYSMFAPLYQMTSYM